MKIENFSKSRGDRTLKEMERRGELISAAFRVLISVTLIASVMLLFSNTTIHSPVFAVSLAYTIVSFIGIVLVLLRIDHPSIPYIFVFIDKDNRKRKEFIKN